MAEDIEKILQNAEDLMEKAESGHSRAGVCEISHYHAIFNGIKAVYEQNKALIMLLKDKK